MQTDKLKEDRCKIINGVKLPPNMDYVDGCIVYPKRSSYYWIFRPIELLKNLIYEWQRRSDAFL